MPSDTPVPLLEKYVGVAGTVLSKIYLHSGDITKLRVDAIVNAANRELREGTGVNAAIHSACGRYELQRECQMLGGHCNTGDAKATSACKLTTNGVKKIIHTVGPIVNSPSDWSMNKYSKEQGLIACYRRSLEVAVQNGCRTIAFPCIGTGASGYPNRDAANAVGGFLVDWLANNHNKFEIDRVVLCTFLAEDRQLYEKFFDEYARSLKKYY